ncbi:MAG: hypothetical protein V3U92_18700 [Cellulophaga sp.]
MTNKSTIISIVATFIWAFMGGYILWDIIAGSFINSHLGIATGVPKEPDFPVLAIGCFIIAVAFNVIYKKWAGGSYSIRKAAIFGVWVGILKGFGSGIIDFATSNVLDLTGTLGNGFTYVVFFAIMGTIAGLIHKKIV